MYLENCCVTIFLNYPIHTGTQHDRFSSFAFVISVNNFNLLKIKKIITSMPDFSASFNLQTSEIFKGHF